MTLEELRARRLNPDYAVDVTVSDRNVAGRTIAVNHIRDSFEIDIESGLILTEAYRLDSEPVRTIRTEALTIREAYDAAEQYEERVRNFLEAHPELTVEAAE